MEVAAKPFNSSTVVVHWKPPSDDKQNGVIRAYQIYIQPKNSVRQTDNTKHKSNTDLIMNHRTRCKACSMQND